MVGGPWNTLKMVQIILESMKKIVIQITSLIQVKRYQDLVVAESFKESKLIMENGHGKFQSENGKKEFIC